jgi:hypothetical protein
MKTIFKGILTVGEASPFLTGIALPATKKRDMVFFIFPIPLPTPAIAVFM